jgi:EAL domain-containing protein (putative c-di-GMP-specific phosphodiesterase class I)
MPLEDGTAGAEAAARARRPSAPPMRRARGTDPQSIPDDPSIDLAALEAAFDRMLATMRMAFQPIVRVSDGAVFGYEALMRPTHPELANPVAVLDAAERLHRLPQLGRSLRALAAHRFGSTTPARGLLFVNIHALDLLDKTLWSRWSPLTRIARRVVLEITERESLDAISDVRYVVARLRMLGFRIAIDDLGAGHDRMAHFDPTDADFVKLDMSLVRDIDQHQPKQHLAASIARLCRDSGIQVIGEGVETASEARALADAGCDLLQGYYFARPGLDFPRPRRLP